MVSHALLQVLWERLRLWIAISSLLFLILAGVHIYHKEFIAPEINRLEHEKLALLEKQRANSVPPLVAGISFSNIEQMEKDLLRFSDLVPPKQQFSDFLGELFQLSDQAKLKIDRISYQPKIDQEKGYLFYSLNFSVDGNYAQLKKFIHLLENSPRILVIDHIALNEKKDQASRIVSLQIKLTTVFREKA